LLFAGERAPRCCDAVRISLFFFCPTPFFLLSSCVFPCCRMMASLSSLRVFPHPHCGQ
jgi:hypothetical protein